MNTTNNNYNARLKKRESFKEKILKTGMKLKSLGLTVALMAAAASTAFAQSSGDAQSGSGASQPTTTNNTQIIILEVDTRTALGSSLNNNDVIVSLAAGLPINLIQNQKIIMPSVLASADMVIPKRVWGSHFTLGAIAGFTATKGDKTAVGSLIVPNSDIPWSTNYYALAVGGRLAYHFNVGINKLDPYLSAGALWVYAFAGTNTENFNDDGTPIPKANDTSGWLPAISGGVRVFVTPYLGLYAELGWNYFATVSAGISYKFRSSNDNR